MMDQCDKELRLLIKHMWPYSTIDIDLLVPSKDKLHGTPQNPKLTVGKIYAGLLALENFRSYKKCLAEYGKTNAVIIFNF